MPHKSCSSQYHGQSNARQQSGVFSSTADKAFKNQSTGKSHGNIILLILLLKERPIWIYKLGPTVFRAQRHKHGFTSCITVTFSVLRPSNCFRKSLKAFIATTKKPEGELQMERGGSPRSGQTCSRCHMFSEHVATSVKEVCGPRFPPLLQRSGPLSPWDLMDRIQDWQN